MSVVGNSLLDLVYPKRCPLCGEVRPYGEGVACGKCLKSLKRVQSPRCFRCGKAVEDEEMEYCQDCIDIPKHFDRGFPVFEYTGAIKDSLYAFKYKNQRIYGEFFANCIIGCFGKELRNLSVEGIVPVPIHRKKRRQRGYNQTELIGRALSKYIGCPMYSDYLERCVNTNPQKELNDISRMKNLKNAFKIGKNRIKLNKILLVDDIYTSGATIEACTQVLKNSGVKEVYYTSVAIGEGFSN